MAEACGEQDGTPFTRRQRRYQKWRKREGEGAKCAAQSRAERVGRQASLASSGVRSKASCAVWPRQMCARRHRALSLWRRVALVDLDWSRVRAVDIFAVLKSFLPEGGRLISVRVYLSDYGKERMEAERVKGPQVMLERACRVTRAARR